MKHGLSLPGCETICSECTPSLLGISWHRTSVGPCALSKGMGWVRHPQIQQSRANFLLAHSLSTHENTLDTAWTLLFPISIGWVSVCSYSAFFFFSFATKSLALHVWKLPNGIFCLRTQGIKGEESPQKYPRAQRNEGLRVSGKRQGTTD